MREAAVHIEKNDAGHTPASGIREVREVMDIRQASSYLGISPDSLYRYASEGTIPSFRLGNRWRFKKSRLDHWMDVQSSQEKTGRAKALRKKSVRSAGNASL